MGQVNFNSYNALHQYTDEMGIKKDLSGDDLKEIVSSLDKDENGNVSLDTFSKAVADKYNKRVDENNEDLDYLIQLFASADGDASTISESDLEIFASTEEDINKNVNELILEEIESTINQRLQEIQADANSKTGFGKLWNGISGAFGGGTKAQENEIKELQELYEHALKHPTKSNLNTLYKKVYGERLNYDEIKMSYQTALNVQNGVYQTADGNVLTLQDVGQAMSEQVNQLAQSFDETVDSQGWISKGFSWLNNNLLGIGQTENMTTAQIKELQNLAGKLASTTDPLEFAGIFKQLTGEELTEDSLSSLLSGVSMVENTRASEAMMDYETTQEVAITTVAAVATGIATATMGPLGGAAVGAAINVGVHGLDAATRNNGKGVLGNLADYATNDLIKDAAVGALNGFSNVVGNKAGAFIKGFLPETTGAAKVGIRLASEFIEGGADGAISNAGEYMVDVMAGDAQFSAGELLTRTTLGFGMGGVMSVGMQEGMSLIGGGVAFLKGTDADGAVKGATDGVQEGLEKGAADGVEDGLEKGAADGVEDGLEKGAADGIEDGLEKGAADGVEDGLEKGAADGVQSSKPTYSKPELDKYKIHEASEILNEQQFKINYAQANNYQISSDGAWAYYNTSSQHSAWKMHVFADSVDDLDNLDPVLKYLRDNNINHKFTGPNQDFAYQTSGIQSGKGITIYPTDVAQMEQLAKDLDYIIKNNDLCRPNTKIHGDNMMGDSGRLFYRYEFKSGSQANDILDLNNPTDYYNYHNNYYKANDATGNYLAPDMNPATDDPWLNFDPSDPASKFGQGPKASGTTSVDGATSTAAHGVQDGAQKGAADGVEDGIEKGAADGIDSTGRIEYASAKLSEQAGLVGKSSGKDLTELQEAINSGAIKSCKEALDKGYTIADIVSIDGKINIFEKGFIDFSDSQEVAAVFNTKIAQQMRVKTSEEIDIIVKDIMIASNCSEQEALQTLQRLTQFSSFKSQPDLAAALSKEQIGSLFDTGSGTSTNKALEYLSGSKEQFKLTGSQQGLILDSSALEYLRKAKIEVTGDIADLNNGIIKINGQKVKLVTVDGWNIGSNGTYSGYSFLGSSLDGNEGLVKICSDLISGKATFNNGIQEEAAAIICQKLGINPNTTNINIANITNDSLKKFNLSSETIADTMAPNMSEEYIQAFFEKFPDSLGAPDAAEYRAALSEYLYDTMTFLSPESTNIAMKDMYKGIQNYLGKMNLTPDDIIYVVPEPTSSFSLVSQQFANVNGIKPSQIITYNGYSACPIDLSGKSIVILDDIVGSGDSMMSQKFNLATFKSQYKDVPVIVAPLSSLEVGVDTITTKLSGGGVVITKHTVTASKKYQNNALINKIIGNTGYKNGYAATFPQYMLPDNNTGISSLFGRMSLINPYSIKYSGGTSFYNYINELYGVGGSIQKPTPDSLCGIIIKRMEELKAKKT